MELCIRPEPKVRNLPPWDGAALSADSGSDRARRLMDLLGLSEDELCAILEADPATSTSSPGTACSAITPSVSSP